MSLLYIHCSFEVLVSEIALFLNFFEVANDTISLDSQILKYKNSTKCKQIVFLLDG